MLSAACACFFQSGVQCLSQPISHDDVPCTSLAKPVDARDRSICRRHSRGLADLPRTSISNCIRVKVAFGNCTANYYHTSLALRVLYDWQTHSMADQELAPKWAPFLGMVRQQHHPAILGTS